MKNNVLRLKAASVVVANRGPAAFPPYLAEFIIPITLPFCCFANIEKTRGITAAANPVCNILTIVKPIIPFVKTSKS